MSMPRNNAHLLRICNDCGQLKKFKRYICNPCRYVREGATISKGIVEKDKIVTYFLTLDRNRGKTYGQLALKYKLDRSAIAKRVKKYEKEYHV